MGKDIVNDAWVKKIIRVRGDYIKVCDYLEFLASKTGIDRKQYFSNVFRYSLDKLTEKGFSYNIERYKPRRIPKGFTIKSADSDSFDVAFEFYKYMLLNKFKKRLFISDFVELLLYIYCQDKLSPNDLKQIEISWGITNL